MYTPPPKRLQKGLAKVSRTMPGDPLANSGRPPSAAVRPPPSSEHQKHEKNTTNMCISRNITKKTQTRHRFKKKLPNRYPKLPSKWNQNPTNFVKNHVSFTLGVHGYLLASISGPQGGTPPKIHRKSAKKQRNLCREQRQKTQTRRKLPPVE